MSKLRRLFILYIVIFMGFMGYSLLIAVFTPLILRGETALVHTTLTLGGRIVLLGIILSLYPFGQFLSSPILGAFSDRFGRKKILLPSLVATTVCYLGLALSIVFENLYALMTFLFLAGCSEGNVVIAQSAIADVISGPERGRYFGYISLSASMAYVIGPLAGGKLAAYLGHAAPFWAESGLLACLFILTVFFYRETHSPDKAERIHYLEAFTNLKHIFLAKHLRLIFFVNFLIYLAIFGFFRCYPMYIVDAYHIGVSKLSEYMAWVAVPIILTNLWLTGFLGERLSPKQLTLLAALLVGVFVVLVVIPRVEGALWVTLFLAGGSVALAIPASTALISSSAKPQEQGRMMGNNQSLQFFAESLSGLVGGLLAAVFIKLSLLVLGFISFLAAAILAFSKLPNSKISNREQ